MTYRHLATISLFLLAGTSAHTALAENKADGLWLGSGGAALAVNSGNSDSSSLALDASLGNTTASDKLSLGAHLDYGRSKVDGVSQTTSDKWNAFGQYDYNLSPQLYGFGKLALESDRIADLDLRSGVEGGLGWKLINTPETLFNLFAGLGWSTDKYGQAQTIGDRTATRFSRTHALIGEESNHQLSASTTFKQRLEIAPGLSGDKATLSRFTAGLAVAMTRTLSLVVNLSNTYNDHPPLGQKRNDTSLFTGINVKFGPP